MPSDPSLSNHNHSFFLPVWIAIKHWHQYTPFALTENGRQIAVLMLNSIKLIINFTPLDGCEVSFNMMNSQILKKWVFFNVKSICRVRQALHCAVAAALKW